MKLIINLIILVAILAALYFAIQTFVAKVTVQISFKGVDLSGISLDNIFNGGGTVKIKINAKLVNRNGFAINLSDFHIWIYYANVMIAQSDASVNNLARVSIPAQGTIDVEHDVNMYLNSTTLQVLKDLKNNKQVRFDFTSSFKVYGFPYTYKDYFNYQL